MTADRETPLTDAKVVVCDGAPGYLHMVDADFARALERALAAAQEELARVSSDTAFAKAIVDNKLRDARDAAESRLNAVAEAVRERVIDILCEHEGDWMDSGCLLKATVTIRALDLPAIVAAVKEVK